MRPELRGDLALSDAMRVLDFWSEKKGLKNVRFSGGEPTLYHGLVHLVEYAKTLGVERIAISTNGSADTDLYRKLIEAGVNDMSISLDACCSDFGKKMCGGISGAWERVIDNIRILSQLTYVNLGMVFTEDTVSELAKTVEFGHSLGVADIRVISAAQYDRTLEGLKNIPQGILDAHPILKYRVNNAIAGRNVRGLRPDDCRRCSLVMDDGVVVGDCHYPCIIYMREGGNPIGKVGPEMRQERIRWMNEHDIHTDPICLKNCLDVCIDYNNRFQIIRELGVDKLSTDPAFGILTRPGLECRLRHMTYPLTVILIDLTDLHGLNGTLGYGAVNERVKRALSQFDTIGRWFSGDEIIIKTANPSDTIHSLKERFSREGIRFKYKIIIADKFEDIDDKAKELGTYV
jgi:GGDEF domain-containing protein